MSLDRRNIPAIITTDLTDGDNDGDGGADGSRTIHHVDDALTPSTAAATSPLDGEQPTTPAIDIQPPQPEPTSSHNHSHQRSPSDPNFLTPILKTSHTLKPSLEVPGTPSLPSPGSDGSVGYPPSPTLSTRSSVHFQQPTTLSLRENQPNSKSGIESLQLLRSNHHRTNSSVSFVDSNDGTEPDSHTKAPPSPHTSRTDGGLSPTVTHVDHEQGHADADKASTVPSENLSESKKKPVSKTPSTTEEARPEPLDPDKDPTDPTPFTFKPLHLASLVDPKSLDSLTKLGGVEALLKGIGTDPHKGLSTESLKDAEPSSGGSVDTFTAGLSNRKRVYGINFVPPRKSKTLLQLMWLAFKDKILILLSVAAVVSLALGLFQDFGTPPTQVTCEDGSSGCTLPRVDWVEGVAIIIAIIIVDVVGSVNDWQKERQFKKLNERKEDRQVKVIRAGVEQLINVKDVLVGDIALLEPGEIIPCDGVFLRGHSVRCDESSATGESDAVKKSSYAECLAGKESDSHDGHKSDCFLISGSKVLEGVGEYVIIAVGPKSFHGRIMLALRSDAEETPLQGKLNHVAELIAKFGSAAGILLFSALMIRFFVQLKTMPGRTPSEKGIAFVNNLVISFTLVVVAVPEGLPLAVTLALAFATKRMTKENLLVRLLASCETMANVSVVCTDKTGTLTQNQMSVVAGSVGIHAKFVRRLEENSARTNAKDMPTSRKHGDDFSVDQAELNKVMPQSLQGLFNEAIAINSTAFEDKDSESGELMFVGSKTEVALLGLAKELDWPSYHDIREKADVVEVIPFSSSRKASGVLVKLQNGKFRLFLKGASEILSKRCTRHVVVRNPSKSAPSDNEELELTEIDELGRDNISRTIIFYANQMLRTIALCYRDLDTLPDPEKFSYENVANDLTLISIVGIEDPLRVGVREAVANCHKAGVAVKMCTGDNVLTARSIASQCGIFTAGGIVMEGPVFRTLNEHDMKEVLPRLQVLARSSPEDKQILVEGLKSMGELVGVTGDGTNDGPALKKANVGFSMGIAGTEVAKEASDIILMDDNFASIVSAIIWGRCVNDAVRKFLQFQISVNIVAVIVTFVTAVASVSEQSALTAVQLLWINIIMDTFAALALATDKASLSLLDRKPEQKSAPLFNIDMWKQILGQATYQTIVVLIFHFLGPRIWHEGISADSPLALRKQQLALQAFIFNTFVFSQIFNSINCRRLDRKLNIFEGILQNWYFIAITGAEIVIQVLIMFFGGAAFSVSDISGLQWGVSIILGLVSIPLGALIRCVPNEPFEKLAERMKFIRKKPVLPTETPNQEKNEWQNAMEVVKDNLNTFSSIRGGRLRSSSIVRKSRTSRPQEMTLSSLMTMVPTFVATSVAGRWTSGGSLSDPAHADPSRSSAALWEGKIQLHPDTAKDDPAYLRWGAVSEEA